MSVPKRELIVGKSERELDEFICGICQEILVEPMVTKCCRQTYCKICINQWFKSSKTCPNDRSYLDTTGMTPAPRLVVNLISELPVKCNFHADGCQEVMAFSQLSSHLKTCLNGCKCGFKGNEDHNCVDFLLDENKRLNKENDKLTKLIKVDEHNQRVQSDPFVGKYCLISSDNYYKKYLEAIKRRKLDQSIVNRLTTIMAITKNDNVYTIRLDKQDFKFEQSFELDKQFSRYLNESDEENIEFWDNLDVIPPSVSTVFYTEGNNKLIQVSHLGEERIRIETEFNDGKVEVWGSLGFISFEGQYRKLKE